MSDETNPEKKGRNAYQLFPDIMNAVSPVKAARGRRESVSPASGRGPVSTGPAPLHPPPPPPEPPDLSRLWQEGFKPLSRLAEQPTALLIMAEGENKATVAKAFKTNGYLVETVSTEQEALERMENNNLRGIVQQTDRTKPLEKSRLHDYLRRLPMSRRRLIYYVLIGPDYNTMYDLQALSLNANLVVNEKDLGSMGYILRKGLQEYENLFGPLLAMLYEYNGRK